MSSLAYVYRRAVVYYGAVVAVFLRYSGETQQTVYLCQDIAIELYGGNKLTYAADEGVENTLLERKYFLFGSQYFCLVFFELFGDVSLCRCQCLSAYPRLRYFVFVGVGNFDIVSEHLIIVYLHRRYARCCRLAFEYLL